MNFDNVQRLIRNSFMLSWRIRHSLRHALTFPFTQEDLTPALREPYALRYLKVDLFFGFIIMIQELCLLLPSNSSGFLLRTLLISSMLLCMAEHKGTKLIMLGGSTVADLPQALWGKWQQLDFQLKMGICSSGLESTESPEKLIAC